MRWWHYSKVLDPERLLSQFSSFIALLDRSGVEILWFDDEPDDLADSIFAYDPSFMTPHGAIILRPGKVKRRKKWKCAAGSMKRWYSYCQRYRRRDCRRGDYFWLNSSTLAVGRGSNENGIHQMRNILSDLDINVVQFDLPPQDDPDACLHLMSVVSPLDHDLALIYEPLMPNNAGRSKRLRIRFIICPSQ